MDPEIKEKLKDKPFVIDWDNGERYYQIHIFEDAEGPDFVQISSKINKEGKIGVYSRASRDGIPIQATVANLVAKEEFDEMTKHLKENLEKQGFIHKFIDLSNCSNALDASQLLAKSDPRFKVEIMHKSDI